LRPTLLRRYCAIRSKIGASLFVATTQRAGITTEIGPSERHNHYIIRHKVCLGDRAARQPSADSIHAYQNYCYKKASKQPSPAVPPRALIALLESRPWPIGTEPRSKVSSWVRMKRAVCASFPRDYCCSPVSPRVT